MYDVDQTQNNTPTTCEQNPPRPDPDLQVKVHSALFQRTQTRTILQVKYTHFILTCTCTVYMCMYSCPRYTATVPQMPTHSQSLHIQIKVTYVHCVYMYMHHTHRYVRHPIDQPIRHVLPVMFAKLTYQKQELYTSKPFIYTNTYTYNKCCSVYVCICIL